MDDILVTQEKRSVKEIFEEKGEEYFRKMENDYLTKLVPSGSCIISTGGGVPCFFNNMDLMKEKGITVYLNRDKELNMRQLLKRKEKRPLIATLTDEEVSDYYDKKQEERSPYYCKALLHVGNADAETIAMMIKSLKL